MKLSILPNNLLETYIQEIDFESLKSYKNLEESELSINEFSFYTSVSAVFSSKIEGEEIELDSYVKHKRFGIQFLPIKKVLPAEIPLLADRTFFKNGKKKGEKLSPKNYITRRAPT